LFTRVCSILVNNQIFEYLLTFLVLTLFTKYYQILITYASSKFTQNGRKIIKLYRIPFLGRGGYPL